MTSQEEQHIRNAVNAYASTDDTEYFLNYGDDIEITAYTPYEIDECRLESQLDSRSVVEHQQPYKGGSVGPLTVTLPSQVDRWAVEVSSLVRGRFQDVVHYYTVPGSEHTKTCCPCRGSGKVDCPTCGAQGFIICPSCHGSGTWKCPSCSDGKVAKTCSSCSGKGGRYVQKSKQEQVSRPRLDYSSGKTVWQYEYVTKYYDVWETCQSCNGRREIFSTCGRCEGTGKVTCMRCHGQNRRNGRTTVTCETCSGKKKLICKTCEGNKTLLESIRIIQELERRSNHQVYVHLDDWDEVKPLPWRKECPSKVLFEETKTELPHNLYPSNDTYNDCLNRFLNSHAKLETRHCHIRFQRAVITRFHYHKVEYDYDGKSYTGYILGDTFHPVNSPIIEYADDLIEDAKSSLKHGSAVNARRILQEAQALNVKGKSSTIQDLLLKVNTHLNVITQLGLKIMFWIVALFATPFVFQYYDAFNPVLPYAKFVNSPDWFCYDILPVAQCILFLLLLRFSRFISSEEDYSKLDYNHALMYVGLGVGKIMLAAVVIFIVLAVVNYLGLSIVTSIAMWLIWWVVKIVFYIVAIIIALISKLF